MFVKYILLGYVFNDCYNKKRKDHSQISQKCGEKRDLRDPLNSFFRRKEENLFFNYRWQMVRFGDYTVRIKRDGRTGRMHSLFRTWNMVKWKTRRAMQ